MSTAAPPVSPEPVALPGTRQAAVPGASGPDSFAAAQSVRGASAVALTASAGVVRCDNCGAAVTDKYCGSCGQRLEPRVHSLRHFAQVALEDLTHADSRLWRTLAALMYQPGFLTREFFAGRRARYLPPVRLYLVLSLGFFLWASVAPHPQKVLQIRVPDRGAPTARGVEGNELCTGAGETRQQCAQRICDVSAYQGPWRHFVTTTYHQVCVRTVLDNGRSEREAFLHNVPRAMFLFLPLLAGVMMLMYWRPRHYYVEHLLLFVHNHALVFLLLLLAGLVSALLRGASGWVNLVVMLYIAWYAYRSMRVVYGQSRWLTVSKLAVLSFFYLVAGSLMLALTSIYSALTL
jgi:Protein of unknown function (DUF3667)